MLTPEDLAAACDTTTASRGQTRAYVNDWIISELLYQEAVRKGIAESESINRQLEAARKQFAINALLEKELELRDSAAISEQAVKATFESSTGAYTLREDVVNVSYILFSERDAANGFRSRVLRGTGWDDALLQSRKDSSAHAQILEVASHQYFTHATLYPEELWKLARTLGKEAVSFVVKTDLGYVVLQVHSSRHQGETPDFDYVRNDVRARLLIGLRRARYEQLLRDLRAKHSVELSMDTTQQGHGESGPSTGE